MAPNVIAKYYHSGLFLFHRVKSELVDLSMSQGILKTSLEGGSSANVQHRHLALGLKSPEITKFLKCFNLKLFDFNHTLYLHIVYVIHYFSISPCSQHT
jgi:hypothetical protein